MTKKIIIFVIASFFITSFAYAQTTTPRERMQERRENIQDKREEVRGRLQESRVNIIRNFFQKMGRRIEAALNRLDRLANRIALRIEELKEKGLNMNTAEAELAEARVKIAEARAAYADAKAKLEAALASETPRESFKQVREGLVKGVVEKIKEAHQALVEAVRAIKNAEKTL